MIRHNAAKENAVKINKHTLLTGGILAGLVLGAAVGEALYWHYDQSVPAGVMEGFSFVGNTFFIGLLKMVLVPLVASSVIVGVSSIGDASQLGRVGGWTVLYYFATMVVAVSLGVALVTTVKPGGDFDEATRAQRVEEFQQTRGVERQRVEDASSGGAGGSDAEHHHAADPRQPRRRRGAGEAAAGDLV